MAGTSYYTETSANDTWTTCNRGSTLSSSSTNYTWRAWVDDGTSDSDNDIWYTWTTEESSGSSMPFVAPINIEDLREQRRQQILEKVREQERKQKEANKKADNLLKSLLTPEQIKELDEHSCFIVPSPSGDKFYRIKRGRAGNIEELNQKREAVATLCIHPRESVPNADTMLAQKLMIETNEDEFLRIANRTPLPVAA